ncbi:uncharacterized protein LOC134206806 [Armigeres subalbatus]|uniref:uncharacterized protein LOC134206806 n=1 Tax=Armigeres subalbatus TaxID=124917 RepID=UPI002ED0F8A8
MSRQVNLGISSLKGQRFDLNGARTVSALELPCQILDVEFLKRKYTYLDGVPVKSYNRVRPRILIGVKHANISLVRRCREGKDGEPIAVKTRLGWTIFGWRSNQEKVDGNYSYHICECSLQNESQLHQEVKQYFCLDSLGIMKPTNTTISIDDERALSLLNSLTRTVENKYETGLLWRFDSIRLPDSRPMALQRLRCLQRRLAKDNDLRLAYNAKLAEYEQKGYIKKVVPEELAARKGQVWYLPTFPVINPNKPGKIRIVWDAAATVRGVSLNSVLLTGPDLLSSLVAVLHKFREYRVGICGDIREMFLQIGIRPEDQFYQLFLWNEDSSEREPSTFIVPVMIFGACSSPTTAQFVKNKNAQRFREEFPLAVEAVENKHYVDDMLASTETEAEAIELANSVKYIHAQGGFDIRNWVSNSTEVLKALGEKPMNEMALNIVAEYATEKVLVDLVVLGMWWNTSTDCFIYKICWTRFDAKLFDGSRPPTKRELLRILMSIFDPLGLISHFLMALKVTLQDVWRIGLKWDDQIEGKQLDSWKTWTERLPKLEELQIPRCYRQITSIGDRNRVQLHTFVDAGENEMAAVVYLRFEEDGHIECALVAAKTRVAPLKYLSTPRSELQAAVIGARLADSIIKSLSIHVLRRFFWCDSRNVLCWLRSDHRRYSQYVAARVSEILDITEVNDWNWIKSEQNVADDGTKWTKHIQLRCSDRWFKGPEFLKQPEPKWPIIHSNQETTTEELRSTALVNTHIKAEEPVVIATKYSNWKRLLKVTAYVKRFVDNIRAKQHQQSSQHGPLVSAELQWAQMYHFRQAQQNVYNEELKILADANGDGHQKRLSTNSRIYKMSPFLDTGVSLNDALMVGPVIQEDLVCITMRFRMPKFAIISDIEKMYRQIWVDTVDRPLQQILWQDKPGEPIRIFQLKTVTYGTSSAPYLATKCLQELAKQGQSSHPVAAVVLAKDFYMDEFSQNPGKQELREYKKTWDEPLEDDLRNRWLQFRSELAAGDSITVPRWVITIFQPILLEAHGFSDASLRAYGACIYFRAVLESGDISVHLLTSKFKVFPFGKSKKQKTINLPTWNCLVRYS